MAHKFRKIALDEKVMGGEGTAGEERRMPSAPTESQQGFISFDTAGIASRRIAKFTTKTALIELRGKKRKRDPNIWASEARMSLKTKDRGNERNGASTEVYENKLPMGLHARLLHIFMKTHRIMKLILGAKTRESAISALNCESWLPSTIAADETQLPGYAPDRRTGRIAAGSRRGVYPLSDSPSATL